MIKIDCINMKTMPSMKEIIRAKIQAFSDCGLTTKQICKKLGINRYMVIRWRNRTDTKNKSRQSRSTKLTPRTKEAITQEMRDKAGASLRKCAKKLNFSTWYQEHNKMISYGSIQSYLKTTDWGKVARKIRVKPLLSSKNIKDRLEFANFVINHGYCDKSRRGQELRFHVLFTDESPIVLHPKPNNQNYRIRTTNLDDSITQKPKFDLKIMVAGGMCTEGLTELIIVDEKRMVNGEYYREKILPTYISATKDRKMFPKPKKVTFMQDGAPCHSANATLKILSQNFENIWAKGTWPGNSPDLNPIEHLWDTLQDSVFQEPRPKGRISLIARVQEKWKAMSELNYSSYIESFPDRINSVIENQGRHTRY